MLWAALFVTVLGLYNLLLPRRFFLVGSRWQLRDGDRAEASDLYVLVVRLGGLAFLLIAVCLTLGHFSLQAAKETRESLASAWDVPAYSADHANVVDDPEVVVVDDVETALNALYGARMGLPTWKTAVVGEDEVGNLGVTVHEGDLWLAAIAGSCTPAVLMVHETATSVTVAMTADSRPLGSFGTYVPCFARGLQNPELDSLVIVRVPLDQPLGTRQVITVNAPERDDIGVPLPPIPAPISPSETPLPSPSP